MNSVHAATGLDVWTHWISRFSGNQNLFRAAVYGNGNFVGVGDDGQIFQSGEIAQLLPEEIRVEKPTGSVGLAIEGRAGAKLILESSPDLKTWSSDQALTNSTGNLRTALKLPVAPQQFYRLRLSPE